MTETTKSADDTILVGISDPPPISLLTPDWRLEQTFTHEDEVSVAIQKALEKYLFQTADSTTQRSILDQPIIIGDTGENAPRLSPLDTWNLNHLFIDYDPNSMYATSEELNQRMTSYPDAIPPAVIILDIAKRYFDDTLLVALGLISGKEREGRMDLTRIPQAMVSRTIYDFMNAIRHDIHLPMLQYVSKLNGNFEPGETVERMTWFLIDNGWGEICGRLNLAPNVRIDTQIVAPGVHNAINKYNADIATSLEVTLPAIHRSIAETAIASATHKIKFGAKSCGRLEFSNWHGKLSKEEIAELEHEAREFEASAIDDRTYFTQKMNEYREGMSEALIKAAKIAAQCAIFWEVPEDVRNEFLI